MKLMAFPSPFLSHRGYSEGGKYHDLERGRDVDVLQSIHVADVMQTNLEPLSLTASTAAAAEALARSHRHGLPVVDEAGDLAGILSIQDLEHAASEGRQGTKVGEICTRDLVLAYPDEAMGTAKQRMGPRDLGRLPVVERENPRHLVGILRRHDIIRAYDLALSRLAALRHRIQQVRLGTLNDEQAIRLWLMGRSNTRRLNRGSSHQPSAEATPR